MLHPRSLPQAARRFPALAVGWFLLAGGCAKSPPAAVADPAPAAQPGATARPQGAGSDETPPPGVDISKLDDLGKKVFFRVVNREPSACGKAHSLIHSVKNDKSCRASLYAARYVVRLVDAGFTDSEIGERLQKRYRSGPPAKIDVSQAPVKGNASAPVTLVEFADFECPHCKRAQPVLKQLVDEYKNDVKVYFKNYPLGQHTNARLAAEASVAAQNQGKFWPYTDKVWDKSEFLTPAELEKIAGEVGLDVAKWRADLASSSTKARVDRDRADGVALGIQSTPSIYINGKLFTDARDLDSLKDWVNEELGR